MGLLDRLRHRPEAPPRRAVALVLEADPGPAGTGSWPGALLVATEDGAHHRVDGALDRGRWLLPGERVPVDLTAAGVRVAWGAVAPLHQRARVGGRPFGDPEGAAEEVAAVLAGAAPASWTPPPALVPGVADTLPDGRHRGHARPLAAAPSAEGRQEVWSVAVPGQPRWGVVMVAAAPTPAEGVEVGVRPGAPEDLVVLGAAPAAGTEAATPEPAPPAGAGREAADAAPPSPAGDEAPEAAPLDAHLSRLDALRASGVLPPAIAEQMRTALEQQRGPGGG